MAQARDQLRPIRLALKRWFAVGSDSGRDRRHRPDRVIQALALEPGMRLADLGAGTGYFAVRLADAVGPAGVVYAVDTDGDLRSEVEARARSLGLTQVRSVAAAPRDPALPEPVDVMFLSGVYHHLPSPTAYFREAARHLRPGGRVAILEPSPGRLTWLFGHATSPERVRAEMEAAGYRALARHDFVERHSLQLFEPAGSPDGR